jgi:hypothetical protein
VSDKRKWLLPGLLMLVFAVTRYPGLLPNNFSAAYALVFCAGAFFPGRLAWFLPLVTMLVTDLLLTGYYAEKGVAVWNWGLLWFLLGNYSGYAVLILWGRLFTKRSSIWILTAGGLVGAIAFYLITNTISWLVDPAYGKTWQEWLRALTFGRSGWPETWNFFRNTLSSSGLFTVLFAASLKLTDASREEEKEPVDTGEEPSKEESDGSSPKPA